MYSENDLTLMKIEGTYTFMNWENGRIIHRRKTERGHKFEFYRYINEKLEKELAGQQVRYEMVWTSQILTDGKNEEIRIQNITPDDTNIQAISTMTRQIYPAS